MADSKITQLPLSPYALDQDLIVAVTGYLGDGSHPYNTKMPLSYIRRYVVRLNLLTTTVSGIDNYYNSGLNILSIWSTGIHAVPGNHVEIQFDANTPAANKYGGVGPICHSGIISVTGLNAYGGNRMDTEENTSWPHSGIIHTTGLNMIDGHGIGYTTESEWPHEYKIFNVEKVKYSNSSTNIYNNNNNISSVTIGNNLLTLDYADFYESKKNQTLSLLGTVCFKINNISFSDRPYAPDAGSLNDQKIAELSAISGTTYNYNTDGCSGDSESCSSISIPQSITWNSGHLANFTQDSFSQYYQNTFNLTIGISGAGSAGLISDIHSYPITFRNTAAGTSTPYYNDYTSAEYYRQNQNPYIINGVDPMIIMSKVNLSINSNAANQYNSLSLCAFISNVRGKRIWTNSVDLVPDYSCDIDCNPVNPANNTYSYETTKCYCDTSASIKMIFIKAENIVS